MFKEDAKPCHIEIVQEGDNWQGDREGQEAKGHNTSSCFVLFFQFENQLCGLTLFV